MSNNCISILVWFGSVCPWKRPDIELAQMVEWRISYLDMNLNFGAVGRTFDSPSTIRPSIRKDRCSIYFIVEQYILIFDWSWSPSVGRRFDSRTFDRRSIRKARCSIYLRRTIYLNINLTLKPVGRTNVRRKKGIYWRNRERTGIYCNLERKDYSFTPTDRRRKKIMLGKRTASFLFTSDHAVEGFEIRHCLRAGEEEEHAM